MFRVNGGYQANNTYGTTGTNGSKKGNSKVEEAKTNKAESTKTPSASKLSTKAQDMLDRLKEKYGNMDFFVADFHNADEAKEAMKGGTKEFSVLFSSSELERMANDEKYAQEKMDGIDGSVKMAKKIEEEFGFPNSFGTNGEGSVTKVGITFNDDGTMSMFAELEKNSSKQRENIEKTREENRAHKKEELKKAEKKHKQEQMEEARKEQKVTVTGISMDELVKNLNAVDWDKVATSYSYGEGDKVDFKA